MLKTTFHNQKFILGEVKEIYLNDTDQWNKFGVYSYGIEFDNIDIAYYGWTINEITNGRLSYVNRDTYKILYG